MNKIINKFLFLEDKFMPEKRLRQPGFTCSACRPFNKNKERIQKFKETKDLRCIYRNELDKSCFQRDMWLMETLKIYLEKLPPIKHYVIKHLILIKIQNIMDIKEVLLQWVVIVLIKIFLALILQEALLKLILNQLAEE